MTKQLWDLRSIKWTISILLLDQLPFVRNKMETKEPFKHKITFVIGPWLFTGDDACDPFGLDPDDRDTRGLNAAILCDTPSANINCSLNSMFVRPLAICFRIDVRDIDSHFIVWSGGDGVVCSVRQVYV